MPQPFSSMTDSYLRQVAPLLHTYRNALHDMTCEGLILHKQTEVVYISVQIHVSVPFTVSASNEVKQYHQLPGREVKTDAEALYLTDLVKMYNDKLRNVVLKELLAGKELQKKDSPLPRKVKKLIDLKNSVEDFSTVVDRISAVYTDRSMDFSSTMGLPSLEDVKQVKDKLCKIRRTLKFHELCSLFEKYDDYFKTNDESVLCTILGLKEDYGKWLFEMDIEMCKRDKYYIERATEEADCLVKQLLDLSFNEETAVIISLNIPNDLSDLQKPSFWALDDFDHVFTYHPLVHNCPRYPENADTVDAWFDIPLPLNNSDEPSNALTNVRMINVSSIQGDTLVKQFLEEGQINTQHHFLYHSTNHKHAMSILTEGIRLSKGKKRQDFSSGDGFYLSETFENARKWNKACKGEQTKAIIVYTIENNLLDVSLQNGWDITEPTEDNKRKWGRVIKYCRNGYPTKNGDAMQMERDLQGITFIRGSMCRNPGHFHPIGFGDRSKIQVCIRDDNYAEKFGSLENIACVIFY